MVWVVFAAIHSEDQHEIVGIYSDYNSAQDRIREFPFGSVVKWPLDEDVPLKPL